MSIVSESNAGAQSLIPEVKASGEAVYRQQVKLLYEQLPLAIVSTLLIAPIFTYIVWDQNKSIPLTIWLGLLLLLTLLRFIHAQQFKYKQLEEINIRNWEYYYLAGTIFSALLWGSTSLWLHADSPASQQVFQIFIIAGLAGGAVATLSSRKVIFRTFLILILLPYIVRFIYIDSPTYLAVAFLICVFIVFMIPISNRINIVLTESLQLRFNNTELLESHKEANELNKKANKALFEIIQKNKAKELETEKSALFLKAVLITANDSIITTDKNGTILTINHAIERDFGYTKDEMIGNSINMIMAQGMGHKHDKFMEQYFNSDRPTLVGRMLDVMGKRKDGNLFPIEITVSETRIDDNIYFTGIIRDTSVRKAQEKAIEEMMRELAQAKQDLETANTQLQINNKNLTKLSELDALTGLANRRFMINAFKREWPRLQRNNKPISVILLDIDFFKNFNDYYGHQAGDGCIKEIADTLAKNIARPADFIARYGGEEFIVVLPETDLDGAYYIAEKMRQAIEKLDIEHNNSEYSNHVTISSGVASIIPNRHNHYELLIKQADEALYEAKHRGRNRIHKYVGPIGFSNIDKK